jgi:site-specific DNA-adenine methylase
MSSLKTLYEAELDKKQAARRAKCASFEEAKAQLAALYRSIVDDREFYDALRAEVELLDDDLRIDPGRIMIVVTAQESGEFRFEYEVKRADDYQVTRRPEVKTIEDVEQAIARLLVEYKDED